MPKGKRIVICADGTWNDPEDENPTNVLRLARAVKPVASKGVKQVVFYDWGVGSYYAKVRGGISGLGMMKNIQDGYRFIVQNYKPGDELYFFGFSRGAYTVRSLAGFIYNCGILKREHARLIQKAFDLYKDRKIHPESAASSKFRSNIPASTARQTASPERQRTRFTPVSPPARRSTRHCTISSA